MVSLTLVQATEESDELELALKGQPQLPAVIHTLEKPATAEAAHDKPITAHLPATAAPAAAQAARATRASSTGYKRRWACLHSMLLLKKFPCCGSLSLLLLLVTLCFYITCMCMFVDLCAPPQHVPQYLLTLLQITGAAWAAGVPAVPQAGSYLRRQRARSGHAGCKTSWLLDLLGTCSAACCTTWRR